MIDFSNTTFFFFDFNFCLLHLPLKCQPIERKLVFVLDQIPNKLLSLVSITMAKMDLCLFENVSTKKIKMKKRNKLTQFEN